jgi:hypothetical protein
MLFRKRKSPAAEASITFLHNEIALLEKHSSTIFFFVREPGSFRMHMRRRSKTLRERLETLKAMAKIRASTS